MSRFFYGRSRPRAGEAYACAASGRLTVRAQDGELQITWSPTPVANDRRDS